MQKRMLTVVMFGLLLILAASAEDSTDTENRAITTRSTMSWNTEIVNSVITIDAQKKGITLPTGRDAAIEMFNMETPALLKDSLFFVLIDSTQRLGDAVETGKVSLTRLYGIIDSGKKTPPYFSLDLKHISTMYTLSLTGLGSLFITHKTAYVPKDLLESAPSRAFTGILIDARGAKPVHGEYSESTLEPCLFPRIWDTDMDLLYEKNMVDPNTALRQGIVRYSAETDEAKYRDLIGNDPLRINAREFYGQYRTDPVISKKDYLRILSVPENLKLLKDGKVVILCDAAALASRNLGPVRDDAYYFAWQEINRSLESTPVKHIDFTSTWEGLKLIMYDVRFVADTAKILPEEQSRLDAIADALKTVGPQAQFTVSGHTASVGKPNGELTLSIARAARIADELVKRGISKTRITSTGFGGTKPVASNDTDEGRALNRRVEITIGLAEKPAD